MSVCQGFSGGPVVNEAGEVVGVVRGAFVESPPQTPLTVARVDAVPAATAVRHLRAALAEFDAAAPR